jgi:elongation factor Ts
MSVTPAMVKKLREETSAGMMDCKRVLDETGGDHDAAVKLLRERGMAQAGKLAGRATTEGRVASYVHGDGKIGVLVEVGCNTDFVAKNDDFAAFCKDIAMHIAAASPTYLRREEVPQGDIDAEMEIYKAQAADKPENVRERIAEGKLNSWLKDIVLLEQMWIRGKDVYGKDTTIEEHRAQVAAQTGENVEIRRFVRLGLGEGVEVEGDDAATEAASTNGSAAS